MPAPRLAVILLNYNCAADIAECLRSIEAAERGPASIYVVDNASTDGSLEQLEHEFPRYTILSSPFNDGFSSGTNVGARRALADGAEWLLFLNPDTTVEPHFFEAFYRFVERNPGARVAGGTGLYYSAPDTIWFGGGHFDWLKARGVCDLQGRPASELPPETEARRCSFLTCACLFVSAAAVRDVGYLDERYFLGGEEWEYSRRLGKAGHELFHLPAARYLHKVTATHVKYSPKYIYNGYRTKLMFLRSEAPLYYLAWKPVFSLYAALLATRAFLAKDEDLLNHRQEVRRAIRCAFADDKRYRTLRESHLARFAR